MGLARFINHVDETDESHVENAVAENGVGAEQLAVEHTKERGAEFPRAEAGRKGVGI